MRQTEGQVQSPRGSSVFGGPAGSQRGWYEMIEGKVVEQDLCCGKEFGLLI